MSIVTFLSILYAEITGGFICLRTNYQDITISAIAVTAYDNNPYYIYDIPVVRIDELDIDKENDVVKDQTDAPKIKNLLEDGRLYATVEDWMNDDRVIVALERTSAEQVPGREELVLVTVDGGSDMAAKAVKFNRGNSRHQCAEAGCPVAL